MRHKEGEGQEAQVGRGKRQKKGGGQEAQGGRGKRHKDQRENRSRTTPCNSKGLSK